MTPGKFTKRDSKGTALHIRMKCDCCPTCVEYMGVETDAAMRWKQQGGTIGNTGIWRCKTCSQNYAFLLSQSLAHVNGHSA